MTLQGEIGTFVDALGTGPTDGRSLAALVLVDLPTARSDYDFGEGHRMYLRAEEQGVEFLYKDGALSTVFISTQPAAERGAYPRPERLIEGLASTAPRAEVLERFGAPEWSSEEADRFQLGDQLYVRFEYVDDTISEISVMQDVPR
jgi:hypothetical protein